MGCKSKYFFAKITNCSSKFKQKNTFISPFEKANKNFPVFYLNYWFIVHNNFY